MILEVYGLSCAHFLSESKAFFFAVNRNDVFDTHGSENGDTDQTDRTAALNDNSAVKAENTRCLRSFNSVNQNRAGFDEDSGIEVEVAYVEDCGTASDEDVIRKPTVEMYVVIGKKAVNVSAAYVLLVEVVHGDIGVILEDHAGNNLIADREGLARAVLGYVFTHFNDLTCAFVTESNGDKTEGIALVFVRVGTANAAAFHFNENVIVADFGHGVLFDFNFFESCEHCNLRCLRNGRGSGSCGSIGSYIRSSLHACKDLLNDQLEIDIIHIHGSFTLSQKFPYRMRQGRYLRFRFRR